MKTGAISLLLMAIFAFLNQCIPPIQEVKIVEDPKPASNIIRVEYPEDGVVCYIYLRDIDCVRK